MSRSEIVTIRAYFSQHVDRFIEQRNQLNANNSNTNNANNDNTTNTSDNATGTNQNNASNSNTNNTNNEDPRIFRLRMEEEWMNLQGPYSEFRLNTNISNTNTNNSTNIQMNNSNIRSRTYINGLEIDATTREITRDFRNENGNSMIGALGTNRDFVWGFVLGYSFGFMTMFIIWLPTVPHKQRVGILSGFCFHMVLKILDQRN